MKIRPWFSQICPDKEAETPHRGNSVAMRKPESIQGTVWISKKPFSTTLLSPVVIVFLVEGVMGSEACQIFSCTQNRQHPKRKRDVFNILIETFI